MEDCEISSKRSGIQEIHALQSFQYSIRCRSILICLILFLLSFKKLHDTERVSWMNTGNSIFRAVISFGGIFAIFQPPRERSSLPNVFDFDKDITLFANYHLRYYLSHFYTSTIYHWLHLDPLSNLILLNVTLPALLYPDHIFWKCDFFGPQHSFWNHCIIYEVLSNFAYINSRPLLLHSMNLSLHHLTVLYVIRTRSRRLPNFMMNKQKVPRNRWK